MANPYASTQGSSNLGLSGNNYGGSNPYLQQNIDNTMGDISRQYQNTVAPQRAGAMARSGSFGNSGQQAMQLEDQRNLGQTMANTSNQMRSADYTQQQAMYQQDQQNSLQNRSLDQQGTLANRGMDITKQGQDNSYNLGLGQNSNQRLGLDNQFTLGKQQNENQRYSVGTNYDLGLRQNDLGNAQLDFNINQGNFNNQLAGADFGLKTYNTLQNGNNLGLTSGQQIQNAPLDYQTQFGNSANAAGGLGGQSSQTMPGSPGSPITGALAGMQLYNAYNQYNPSTPSVTDGGYSIGQGSAYGGNRSGL